MPADNYRQKPSLVVVYTGEGKGKTSAALGLAARALGNRMPVAFIQFIKYWGVSEHVFLRDISPLFKEQLYFYKGGKGFYKAGDLSAPNVTAAQHKQAALQTYQTALACACEGRFQVVICDEINNAVHDGLLSSSQLKQLITKRAARTSLCLTGRNFPPALLSLVDIATDMRKLKHHYDDGFLASPGLDY